MTAIEHAHAIAVFRELHAVGDVHNSRVSDFFLINVTETYIVIILHA